MVAHGATPGDGQADVGWVDDGHGRHRTAGGRLRSPAARGPGASAGPSAPGVTICAPAEVLDLTATGDRGTGVRVRVRGTVGGAFPRVANTVDRADRADCGRRRGVLTVALTSDGAPTSTDFLHVSGGLLTQLLLRCGRRCRADAAGMAFGVLRGRALHRVVRESGGVTLAVAALTAGGAVFVADSLRTELGHGVPVEQAAAARVGRRGNCAVLLTGLAAFEGRDLLADVLAGLGGQHDVGSAARVVSDVMLAASSQLRAHFPDLLAVNESLWDVILAVEEQRGRWQYPRLRQFRGTDDLEFEALALTPGPGEVLTVVLGAWHPQLGRLDSAYAAGYADVELTARAMRMPAPPTPRALPMVGLAAAVTSELDDAIATEGLARRPADWPAGTPVAAGPVQLVTVGRPGGSRRRFSRWRRE